MNRRFLNLPEEKRLSILNAGMEAFGKNGYKKASTEEIANMAGISKALLFHYFGSKREFYLYLYQYAKDYLVEAMRAEHDFSQRDMFRILEQAQASKIRLRSRHPHLMSFLISTYYEESEAVKPEMDSRFRVLIEGSRERTLARVDGTKFKEGIEPAWVLDLILWMSDGFMRSRTKEELEDVAALNREFMGHLEKLRRQFYKEEYL